MKKALVVVAGIVFFLILLALLAFKLFAPEPKSVSYEPVTFPVATTPTGAVNEDGAVFVRSFYAWYLENFSKDPLFPHPENRDEVLKPWLSDEFLSQWDQIQLEAEANPVLLTAEDPTTWGSGITAEIVGQSIRSRTIRAAIGSGQLQHVYTVELVRDPETSSWKIVSVANAL